MVFWIHRKTNINKTIIFKAANEILAYCAKELGVNSVPSFKPYFGRGELAHLIELDMLGTPSIVVAEQMHLVWCIGYVCGVRPGTIASAKHRPNHYLAWRDVEITRDRAYRGAFACKLTFRWLKGNREPTQAVPRKLEMPISAPDSIDTLTFSITHRLLILLLRRKLLSKYSTFEELVNDNTFHIAIKPQHLDDPVFYSIAPRGLELTTTPATSDGLSSYLSNRAQKHGYPSGCTMYAWRRKAGTQVAAVAGVEKAKVFMDHHPNSFIFEKHYDQGLYDLDVFAIAMGAKKDAIHLAPKDSGSFALMAMKHARQGYDRKRFLEQFTNEHLDMKKAIEEGNANIIRSTRSRIRRLAWRALLAEDEAFTRETLTTDEIEARRRKLAEPGYLIRKIDSRMQELAASNVTSYHSDDDLDIDDCIDMEEDAGMEQYADEDGLVEDDEHASQKQQEVEAEGPKIAKSSIITSKVRLLCKNARYSIC